MKILIQTLNFAPDVIGVPKYSGELAADLSSRGHDVRVLTAPPYYPHWKITPPYRALAYRAEAWQGCTVRRVPLYVPQRPTGLKRLAHHAFYAAASLPLVADEMVRHRPDVVLAVAPSLLAAPATALAARLAGVPCWLHIQDLEVDAAFELGLLHSAWSRALAEMVERRVYSLFHRVSTISEAMRRRLIAKGVRDERCVLLRNWVDSALPPDPYPTRAGAQRSWWRGSAGGTTGDRRSGSGLGSRSPVAVRPAANAAGVA
jgi:colanic acid biosynthesis glycosyl transferase WcaI